jgi:hypothetical protein
MNAAMIAELRVATFDILSDYMPRAQAEEAIRSLLGTGPADLGVMGRILADLGKSPTMPALAFELSRAVDLLLIDTPGPGAGEALRLRFVVVPQ